MANAVKHYADGVLISEFEDITVNDDLTVTDDIIVGGEITNASGDLTIKPASGITIVGDAGSTSHSLAANDDILITGIMEVNGALWADGPVTLGNSALVKTNIKLFFGDANNCAFRFDNNQTNDSLIVMADNSSRTIIMTDQQAIDTATDYAIPNQSDPTLKIASTDDTDITKLGTVSWQEQSIGAGKGGFCGIKSITEEVTIAVAEGATPVVLTAGNLAPANSLIFGAVARITDAPGGGATTVDIGVTGSGNLDTLVDGMSTALNTTATTAADGDGTQLPLMNAAAATLTLTTDADVTGDEMKVRVAVFYMEFTPFTS